MKKLLSVFLALSMAIGLTACSGISYAASSQSAANDPKVILTYAEVNPENSLMGSTARQFKQKVEELSGGSVTIDIQYSGVMGAEGDVLDTMIGGGRAIDMARVATFSLTSYGAKKTSLLSVPVIFGNLRKAIWARNFSTNRKILNWASADCSMLKRASAISSSKTKSAGSRTWPA